MGIKDVDNFFHMNSKDGHPLWESMEIQNLISNQSFTNLLKKRCNILYVSLKRQWPTPVIQKSYLHTETYQT